MDQLPTSATMFHTFEATIAVYGVVDINHNILSRKAAEQIVEQMRGKIFPVRDSSVKYRVTSARLEGDEQRGQVLAIFTFDEHATQQAQTERTERMHGWLHELQDGILPRNEEEHH